MCILVWVIFIYVGILFSLIYTVIYALKCPPGEEDGELMAHQY